METVLAGFVGGGGNHPAAVGFAADYHRFALKLRLQYLLYRDEEGI
jgi:hypothetical protein